MSFYTGKGDDGTTGLLGKGRIPKHALRIEAIGTLDEASAALGVARASAHDPRCPPLLLEIQRDFYQLMAEVAAVPLQAEQFRFDRARVDWLEEQIQELGKLVQMPGEFIVPGDTPGSAALSLARTVVRRAERRVVELFDKQEILNPALQQYLNRLSSLLFVLELVEIHATGMDATKANARK
jgi:cob(I)alamin adenosyltransferase